MKKSITKPKVPGAAKARSASKEQSGVKASSSQPKSKPKPRAPSGDGSKHGKRRDADGPSADAEEVLETLEETYKKQCEEAEMPSVAAKPVPISLRLIARRNLPRDVADGPQDKLKRILLSLPNLRQLDGVKVTRQERLEAGCQDVTLSSDEEEDEEEENDDDDAEELTGDPPSTFDDDVLQLSADLIKKSRQRSRQQAAEHYRHMEQLVEARSQSQMAMNTARSSLGTSPRSSGRTAPSTPLGSEQLMSGSATSR